MRTKRWMRFSLSTLLGLVTVTCVWLGVWASRARLQREVVELVQQAGGSVTYEHEEDRPGLAKQRKPGIIERVLGVDFVQSVVKVSLDENVDDLLPKICRLPKLQELWLGGDVTDLGIENLRRCQKLTHLGAPSTSIGDDALKVIGRIQSLKYLDLGSTRITSGALKHLTSLSGLEELHLWGEEMTDEAMPHISKLRGLKQLHIQHCNVTTEGLGHVTQLPNLEALAIAPARFDDRAIDVIEKLDKLRWLVIRETGVSDAAIAELMKARPRLSVH